MARLLENEDYRNILGNKVDTLTNMHIHLRSTIRSYEEAKGGREDDRAKGLMMTARGLIADISGSLYNII
jgi:hypothetical protein